MAFFELIFDSFFMCVYIWSVLCVSRFLLFPDGIGKLSCFCCQFSYFVKCTGFHQIAFDHPASSAAEDFIAGKIFFQVCGIDSSGRHKPHSRIRCSHRFDHRKSSCRFCREEFHHFKPSFYRLRNFGRGNAARKYRNLFFQAVIHNLRIKARTYNNMHDLGQTSDHSALRAFCLTGKCNEIFPREKNST